MIKTSKITTVGTTALALGFLAAVSLGAHAAPKNRHANSSLVLGDGQIVEHVGQRLAEKRDGRGEAWGFENVRKDISNQPTLSTLGKITADTR